MKILRLALLMVVSSGLTLVAACSSSYEMTTRDGETIVTDGKPKVNKDEGFVEYEKNDTDARINEREVREIKEVD